MQKAIQLPKEVEEELTMLRGFRDLIGERTGYFFGAKALTKTMSDETATERKAVTALGKALTEANEKLLKEPNKQTAKAVIDAQSKVETARKANAKAREPHMKKINPLRKAVKYIDVVAVPDSLKEMGKPVTPRFSLSEWVAKAIEQKKQKND